MSSALDMSLEDIIKNNKKSAVGSRGRGRGSGTGPARRVPNRSAIRSAPYSFGKLSPTLDQEGFLQDGHEVVVVQGGKVVAKVEAVANQYLLQHLMLIWTSTMKKQCKLTECLVCNHILLDAAQ
ncbi:hypothetical protein BHE74_00031855 [Ensete ventricosum]|nr:hypothetical protein BHE74_00031855 [Ensete ventricosum]